jgi:Ca-activated chloride channel family protein
MSFGNPLVLVALVLLPVAVAYYVAGERRRRVAARAFASDAMLASVAPRQPRWRRHAPLVFYGLALAVLVIAAAKPRTTTAVPVDRATIMLLNDVSGSMQARDVRPNRLVAAREAARAFVDKVPHTVRVGIVAFNQNARTLQPPTTDHADLNAALDQLRASGTTATGDALNAALTILQRQPGVLGKRPPSAIVLLTDGASRRGQDPVAVAKQAARLKIPIYTVALGTPEGTIRARKPGGGTVVRSVPPDPASLEAIARASRGKAFSAEDADQLSTVYKSLGHQLGTRKAKREVTAAFVGGALILLVFGSAMSLRWFGRLP